MDLALLSGAISGGGAEIEAARCYKHFRYFLERAWREIDPAPFIKGWHTDAIADHLQAVYDGHIKNLIINIPPGLGKSMIASVLWPAWCWARKPSLQFMGASYEAQLSTRDAVKCRTLMSTPWYINFFRSTSSPFLVTPWDFEDDQNLKTMYKNTQKGHRQAIGVGGKGTGYRGDILIIDDPISAGDAHSKVKREAAIRWKDETMSSRFNNKAEAREVLIMQRLHEDDLTGHLLRKGGWEHLRLPSRFEAKDPCRTRTWRGADFWKDPRKEEGALLFPALLSDKVLTKMKVDTGSYGFAGQYQQRPAPASGGIIKSEWFNRRWALPGVQAPEGVECRTVPLRFDHISMFTDAAFKKTEDSDYVAIGVFGVKGPDVYLLQIAWKQMTFSETVTAILDLHSKWSPQGLAGVFVEDKANGTAVMDVLKGKISGIIPVEPDGGKEARIAAVAPFIEAGNLWLPLYAPWVSDYVTEASSFPKAAHDDAIDMTAYALVRYCGSASANFLDQLSRAPGFH